MKKPRIDIAKASFVKFSQHLDWILRNQTTEEIADALRKRARARGLKHSAQIRLDELVKSDIDKPLPTRG